MGSAESVYATRFWKRNWDPGLDDLDPSEYETTFVEMSRRTFAELAGETAFGYLGVNFTFGALDSFANQFANTLLDQGFEKGDIVGINLPNIPEYLIAVLGALRAGCVFSGVSPLLSAEQIRYQLGDLGEGGKKVALVTLDAVFAAHIAKIASELPQLELVIVTNIGAFLPRLKRIIGRLAKKIPAGKVTPLAGKTVLDFHRDILAKQSRLAPKVVLSPPDLVCIQYTGGTTGPPKGAMLDNRNVSSNIKSIVRWLGWEGERGVILSGFPMFHIAGLTIATAALYAGWTQVLIPDPRDTDHICEEMERYRVTNLVNVPSLYQRLMAKPRFRRMDHSRLGICVCAASPFPKESQVELESIIGRGKLLELYGMTETSPVSVMNPAKGRKKLGSVGLPFLNVELKLVDPDSGREVPLGEPGEICVKGPLVMRGYHNKPEETKKVIDADGYLHTGDVAIMDEDGYLRIVDRTKDMIIVSGYKVFSSKVEDTLAKHPAIGTIALVGIDNPERPGSEIVKAYVQLAPDYAYNGDEKALKEDITRFAREHCAPYEVPKVIEIVDELPLTAIGKVDKKVLRAKSRSTEAAS